MNRILFYFQLIACVFSFRKDNMRFPNLKRIFMVVLISPVFLGLFIIHRIFMLLDYVFFPTFTRQKILRPTFIVSAPRSGTTFLFHTLANQKEIFSSMKLWEMILAPSITQKYLLLLLRRFDIFIGSPILSFVSFIEKRIVGKFKTVHLLGLKLPEEDEVAMIWNLNTLYLSFFYPDSQFFKRFYYFDESLPVQERRVVMRSYLKLIQRHNYVFNRNNSKIYLSKNPLMMNKIKSLNALFPDAKILVINRCPDKTIPSTVELNAQIYQFFTSLPLNERVKIGIVELLIQWYKMAESNLEKYFSNQTLKIDFISMMKSPSNELMKMSNFLGVHFSEEAIIHESEQKQHVSNNKYIPLSPEELERVLNELPFLKDYCHE